VQRLYLTLEPAVSGSESTDPTLQNLAESREFLGVDLNIEEESLPTQTQSRWAESMPNSSVPSIP
jgi:hypothetical protein